MKSGTVDVLLWLSAQLLLSCLYSSTSCTVVRYVQCMQQENNYCCRACTAGKQLLLSDVYRRINSYCCQMCRAGNQLLLSYMQSRKSATVVRCVQQDNSYCCGKQLLLSDVCSFILKACIFPTACSPLSLCPSICPSFCLRVSTDLPLSISVSPYSITSV